MAQQINSGDWAAFVARSIMAASADKATPTQAVVRTMVGWCMMLEWSRQPAGRMPARAFTNR